MLVLCLWEDSMVQNPTEELSGLQRGIRMTLSE